MEGAAILDTAVSVGFKLHPGGKGDFLVGPGS